MVINKEKNSKVKFVSYDGKYPNLCSGTLVLEVNGKTYKWGNHSGIIYSGGGLLHNYEGTYNGEWNVDYAKINDEIKDYAEAIDACINENITYGCCGGCI
jgi:hypothetical protein